MSRPNSEIYIYNPNDASTANFEVLKVSDYTYQLMSNDPFQEALCYGTLIEVEKNLTKEGDFQLKRIVKASDYTLEVYPLPNDLNETELRIVGDMIVTNGGYWEVNFGGLGYVSLPKHSTLDVIKELENIKKNKLILKVLNGLIKALNS